MQILHKGVIAMKTENRQTLPKLGRSTKKKNAGLSLHTTPPLFFSNGDSFTYYNEVPFLWRLKKKVSFIQIYGRLSRSFLAA
jgi:hypothetical protein